MILPQHISRKVEITGSKLAVAYLKITPRVCINISMEKHNSM